MTKQNHTQELSESCSFNVIYVYCLTGIKTHEGVLKIGDTLLKNVPADKKADAFPQNCEALKNAARARIKEQTVTAGLFSSVEILHVELAVADDGRGFHDLDVHGVLRNSGINPEEKLRPAREWFRIDLETAKAAIDATKEGKPAIRNISFDKSPIALREEQKRAIEGTCRKFKKPGASFLWNAKMRFGKTLSALQTVKEMGFSRTIIVTHRPAVLDSWREEFGKVFYEKDSKYLFGSKDCIGYDKLEKECSRGERKFIYFASLQDLRGSELISGDTGFDKNQPVFNANWDCIIVDEAHEGTQTTLGGNVVAALRKPETRTLSLSGTPFCLIDKYKEDEVFTWDYIEEQQAKLTWEENHPGGPNPYATLPRMNIRTYDLGEAFRTPEFIDAADKAFSFAEFFRIDDTKTGFKHETDVRKFLDLLAGKSPNTNYYPFANDKYRAFFRHSFWIVPGVKEARRLKELLDEHPVFGLFKVVNVAGEEGGDDPLRSVKDAIRENDFTITLSCGRLTTGVTVPEWTAVLYLAGGYKTSPAAYMQTIFRVQSPGSVNGRVKEECYAFDFAPDRAIAIIEQVAQYSAGTNKKHSEREKRVRKFIDGFTNFAPVIAYSGSETTAVDTNYILQKIKKLCITQVVQRGFASPKLFNNKLWNLSDDEVLLFDKLEGKIGKSSASSDLEAEVVINSLGMTEQQNTVADFAEDEVQYAQSDRPEPNKDEQMRRKRRENALAVLTNAAVRVPLLVFGADGNVEKNFSADNFPENFDDKSWEEFMGKLSKDDFRKIVAPYLDQIVFSGACSRIRERVLAADSLSPRERIRKIVELHSEFKNPDKETVLTPWRVVCRQLSDTLGGYNFWDESRDKESLEAPKFVGHGNVTDETLANPDARILEINSKTGLYPLFVAYSLMRAKLASDTEHIRKTESVDAAECRLWKETVEKNLFVVCKTKMAKAITRRTLLGFDTETKANIIVEEQIVAKARNTESFPQLVEKIINPKTWNLETSEKMKFNAIVGNPPYQDQGGSGGKNDAPIYQYFVLLAQSLKPDYISLIIKAAWFSAGREYLLGEFRKQMLANRHVQKMFVYPEASDVFPSADIKGGICYFLENSNYKGDCEYAYFSDGEWGKTKILLNEFSNIFIRNPKLISIVRKVLKKTEMESAGTVDALISSDTPFGIPTNPTKSKKTPFALSKISTEKYNVRLYYIKNPRMRSTVFVRRADIKKNTQDIDKIKVLMPNSGGSGSDKLILSRPELAPKNSVCSQSYLYATFTSAESAKNFISYYKTKFFRVLVSAVKVTQHAFSHVYRFVPVQDFSKPWTDAELYKKYKLSKDEIAFIESVIRPMS